MDGNVRKTVQEARSYLTSYGERATFAVEDDISRAIGKHDWAVALLLLKVRPCLDRLMTLYLAGRLENRRMRDRSGTFRPWDFSQVQELRPLR